MKKYFILTVITIICLFAFSSSFAGTTVYRFADEPFVFNQCYNTGDWVPGPAAEFGENVCVDYVALNSETVRIKNNKDGTTDVGWNLIQQGTATITSVANGGVLYVGPFQVEEIGQDDGNDSNCTTPDGHAWLGKCGGNIYSTLDYALYQWKITGNKVYFFKLTVKGPGQYCYDAKGVAYGPGCN